MKNYLIKSINGNQYLACPIAAHKAYESTARAQLFRWSGGTWRRVK